MPEIPSRPSTSCSFVPRSYESPEMQTAYVRRFHVVTSILVDLFPKTENRLSSILHLCTLDKVPTFYCTQKRRQGREEGGEDKYIFRTQIPGFQMIYFVRGNLLHSQFYSFSFFLWVLQKITPPIMCISYFDIACRQPPRVQLQCALHILCTLAFFDPLSDPCGGNGNSDMQTKGGVGDAHLGFINVDPQARVATDDCSSTNGGMLAKAHG